jgi:diacylglycerol kinase family enzyme
MKALLIMNPGSRSGKGKQLWSFWESRLQARRLAFDSAITTRAGHGVELAAGSKDYDTVVAVGGDGTINEVLDGVIQSGRPDLRMGVLYSGTSPDFCKFHNIPTSPSDAVETLAAGISRKVDVGRITCSKGSGERITAHFGCGVNVGVGASVARISNLLRRFTGDLLGTCIAVIYSIMATRPTDIEAIIDGSSQLLSKTNNISILKNPFIASGLRLNLDLLTDDGRLVLFAVHGKTRFSVLSILPDFYSGKAAGRNDVFIRKCKRLTITAAKRTEVEFDGDPRGFLPAEIEILPTALDLIGADNERV